ncbi:MAG: XRE family transcriptional regulator [Desulfurococcaceae archaeon]
MRSVFELLARHVEPSLKRGLVEKLSIKGMSGKEIASCLGLSPSLVTRYSRKERGLHDFTHIPVINEKLDKLAEKITSMGICGEEVYVEIGKLAIYILQHKYACEIHYGIDRSINPIACKICSNLFSAIRDHA